MTLRITLIEDDFGDAELVRAYLEDGADAAFEMRHACLLADGVDLLAADGADIALLDLNLPDSTGLTTFTSLRARFPETPIIVLSGLDDREISTMAVREGAQDFLVKGAFDGQTLFRAILHAIERHQLYRQLAGAALSDELTGLFNRRGFLTLAGQLEGALVTIDAMGRQVEIARKIVEIIAHVALNLFTNYVNIALAVPLDFPAVSLRKAA